MTADRNSSPAEAEMVPPVWRCFHCDETFTSERCARLHFGRDEGCLPACQIKGSEGGLVAALRRAEDDAADAWAAIHAEATDAVKAYQAQRGRHREQLTAIEQIGYDRGLADAQSHPETIGLTAAPKATEAPGLREAIVHAVRMKWRGEIYLDGRFDSSDVNAMLSEAIDAALSATPQPVAAEPVAWCQPMREGHPTPRVFVVRYEDQDVRDCTFDNEAEARDHWQKANGAWNCYLLASLPLDPEAATPQPVTVPDDGAAETGNP